jgi:hypothetical protein
MTKKSLLLLSLFAALTLPARIFAQQKTTVSDALVLPTGGGFIGTVTITPAQTFVSADGYTITPVAVSVTTGASGQFTISLVPNIGASPSGTYYNVFYQSATAIYREVWVIPSSTTNVTLQQVRVIWPEAPAEMIPITQLTPPVNCVSLGGVPQYTAQGWTCTTPSGTAAVSSVFGRTGTVTAQTGDYSFSQISGSLAYSSLSGLPTLPGSATAVSHEWLNSYSATTGGFTLSQPAFTDISGSLSHSQLPALVSGDIPNNAANTTGNAATATALAATPTLCSAGYAAQGILASGNATGCTQLTGGGGMSWPSSAGIAVYAGSSAWGSSLTVGSAASDIPQLNASAQLPASEIPALSYVTSVALSLPSWLSVSGSPVTSSGTFNVTAAGSQTSHEVIGTCGTATSFSPCALVAGDIPASLSSTTSVNGTSIPASATLCATSSVCSGYQAALTNPVTGPGSGVTVGHLATFNNTSGTAVVDGGAVPAMVYPGAGIANSTGSAWGTSYAAQGTDSKLLTSGTVSGTAATLCTDANGGATTSGCSTSVTSLNSLTGALSITAGNGITVTPSGSTVQIAATTHALGYSFGDAATGSALTTSEIGYVTVPFACTIAGWHIMVDAGTATVKTYRVNGGTANPTSSNSISTSGVSISTGTKVDSTTVTDFTSTAIAANDTLGFAITTVATAKQLTFQLDCK